MMQFGIFTVGDVTADPTNGTTNQWAFNEATEGTVWNGYFLSPWPFETVPRIHEALRVQKGFGELVERSSELSDAELQAEFRALMAGGK